MQWSRNKKGEKAVSFVSVDGEVSDDILMQLRKTDGVLKANMFKL
jgi:D-3-phosphoglycerate dehydrogenase